jgi:ATP-dependent DNA ligase
MVTGNAMPSWVEPQLATLTRERFSDPSWIYERKLDGERCLAFAGRTGGQACRDGWEGLIAKRADAPYQGGRSRDWLKFKCGRAQEFVIGGYTDPQGLRDDKKAADVVREAPAG